MNNRIFVDSDIILDLLSKRHQFYEFSAELFTLGDMGKIQLVTTSLVFANVFYILKKTAGLEKAKELLRKLRILISVVPVREKAVDLALNSDFADFEDALQYFTAQDNGIEIILTRNIKDYKKAGLIVQTAEEFLKAVF